MDAPGSLQMGVTLHYRGRLSPKEKPRNFYILAKIVAQEKGWTISDFEEGQGSLDFRKMPGKGAYRGPVQSFVIKAHENCEPIHFRIAEGGRFEERCKTQFAPVEVHIGLVDLLDRLKIRLAELTVEDEGHYWELRDKDRLEANLYRCFEEIVRMKEEDPSYYGPVKEEDGRITDLVKG